APRAAAGPLADHPRGACDPRVRFEVPTPGEPRAVVRAKPRLPGVVARLRRAAAVRGPVVAGACGRSAGEQDGSRDDRRRSEEAPSREHGWPLPNDQSAVTLPRTVA